MLKTAERTNTSSLPLIKKVAFCSPFMSGEEIAVVLPVFVESRTDLAIVVLEVCLVSFDPLFSDLLSSPVDFVDDSD